MNRILAFAALLAWMPSQAWAQSCSLNIGNLNFGSVNPFAVSSATASSTVRSQCSTLVLAATGCPSIGFGSGGTASSPHRRLLGPGGSFLEFDLFRDAAYTVPFGSRDHSATLGAPQPRAIGSLGGPYVGAAYARLRESATIPSPGTYSATFSGTGNAYLDYGLLDGLVPCNSPLLSTRATTSFTVSATVPSQCRIEAAALNFGTTGVISGPIDAATTLSVQCTPGTSYSIAMDGGQSQAADPTNRQMTGLGGSIRYGIYRNPARSQTWGVGSAIASGTGTGLQVSVPVYGRVPSQPTPRAGTYNDVVVVTITYGS